MAKLAIVRKGRIPQRMRKRDRGPNTSREGALPEIEDYATDLTKMSNSEVSSQAEAALLELTPGAEIDANAWWRIRVLFDELRWRLSGLE